MQRPPEPPNADEDAEHLRPASFGAGAFRPHGNFDLRVSGQVARSVSTGPFNAELMVAADQARRVAFRRLGAQGPFGVITTMHGSILCPLEALALLEAHLREEVRDGVPMPVAFAWVVSDAVEGKGIMADRYVRAYRSVGIRFRICGSQEEAERWVAESLAGQ